MGKTLLTIALTALTSTAAVAQYVGPSDGVSSETVKYPASTVAGILTDPRDDAKVTLEGHLLRKTGHETYVFSDGTGEITVEIDDDDLPSQPVDADTKIRIEGEIDTHLIKDTDVNADRVTIIK